MRRIISELFCTAGVSNDEDPAPTCADQNVYRCWTWEGCQVERETLELLLRVADWVAKSSRALAKDCVTSHSLGPDLEDMVRWAAGRAGARVCAAAIATAIPMATEDLRK